MVSSFVLYIANCGAPSPPQDGHILYTSTLEGAEAHVTCASGLQENMTCGDDGRWRPTLSDICNGMSGSYNY